MLHLLVLLNLVFIVGLLEGKDVASDADDFGSSLITSLRNDANLDLSMDEEYEDLRAELLAYHTALASLSDSQSRRSMMSTPCWELGGICIKYELCVGYRFMTEVPGCKNRLNVCCFAWNKFKIKDFRDKGIGILAMPWSLKHKYGGQGIMEVEDEKKITKTPHNHNKESRSTTKQVPPKINEMNTGPGIIVFESDNDEQDNDWSGDIVQPEYSESGDRDLSEIYGE